MPFSLADRLSSQLFAIFGTALIVLALLLSYFLEPSASRLLLVAMIALTSVVLSLVMTQHRWRTKRIIATYVLLFLVFIVYILPITRGGLAVFLKGGLANEQLLIFNHEIDYDINEEKLVFFQNPSNHHAYYPLSYILAKIVYEITRDSYFLELILFPGLSALFFIALIFVLTKKANLQSGYLENNMLLYSFCLLLLSYVNGVGALSLWWFRSVGNLLTITLLCLFSRFDTNMSRNVMGIIIFLFLGVILSDSLICPLSLISFLLYSYYLTKNSIFLRNAKVFLILFLGYQTFVGFISLVLYSDYFGLLKGEFEVFISHLSEPQLVVSDLLGRQTLHTFVDKASFMVSYALIYGVLLIIPIIYLKTKKKLRKIAPLFIVLTLAYIFVVGARLIPITFVNIVADALLYGPFTFMMLALGMYAASLRRSKLGKPYVQSPRYRWFDKRYIGLFFSLVIIFSSSINALSLIYPKSIYDPIEFIDDPRIAHYNTWFVAGFLNSHWDGKTSVHYHVSTHAQDFFLKDEITRSTFGRLITLPRLPTIFKDQAELYEKINISCPTIYVIYDQGYWLIVMNVSRT